MRLINSINDLPNNEDRKYRDKEIRDILRANPSLNKSFNILIEGIYLNNKSTTKIPKSLFKGYKYSHILKYFSDIGFINSHEYDFICSLNKKNDIEVLINAALNIDIINILVNNGFINLKKLDSKRYLIQKEFKFAQFYRMCKYLNNITPQL